MNIFIESSSNNQQEPVSCQGGYGAPYQGDTSTITIQYNPSTNYLSITVVDQNGRTLAQYSYALSFTPSPGWYIFGVAGVTGGANANWGITQVSISGAYAYPIPVGPYG